MMLLFPPPVRVTPRALRDQRDFSKLIRNASRNCRANAQRAVNLDEIVREVV
jgi:hypothetical protein